MGDVEAPTDAASEALLPPRTNVKPRKKIFNWIHDGSNVASGGKRKAQIFLTSKAGHYFVLGLVSLDVLSIIADFVLHLFTCERPASERGWYIALDVLSIISLVFSSLFMVELLLSIWAFGKAYFHSWFHCFDAFIIVASFIVDVLLRGVLEEVASLVIVLRLWRVFKIIEELSAGADEQFTSMEATIAMLQLEKSELEDRVRALEEGR